MGSRKANVERLEEEQWIGDRRKIVGDELESARISSVSDAAGPPSDFYRTNMRIILAARMIAACVSNFAFLCTTDFLGEGSYSAF